MKRVLVAIMAICTVGAAAMVSAQAAADASLTDFSGEARSIGSYAGDGKWLVVKIWAHDCHVCNIEAENYAYFHEEHKDRDARMLGISIDGQRNRAGAEDFIERHALPYPNLIGEPEAVMLRYRMLTGSAFRGTPTLLIYAPDGTLKAAQAGAVPVEIIERFIASNQSGSTPPD